MSKRAEEVKQKNRSFEVLMEEAAKLQDRELMDLIGRKYHEWASVTFGAYELTSS